MEEPEIPTEKLQEDIHHHAQHAGEAWVSWLALSTAILAALAAATSLLAGHHANEAMIEQVRASDQWSYYQAKGIKKAVKESRNDLLTALGHAPEAADRAQVEKYDSQQREIDEKAQELEASSHRHLHRHEILARGVTMYQIAIAIGAVAALVRKRPFWYLSLGLGVLGIYFMIYGMTA